jgi:hypothetical protein
MDYLPQTTDQTKFRVTPNKFSPTDYLSNLGWSLRNASTVKQLLLLPDLLFYNRQNVDGLYILRELSEELFDRLNEVWDIESGQFIRHLSDESKDDDDTFYNNIKDMIHMTTPSTMLRMSTEFTRFPTTIVSGNLQTSNDKPLMFILNLPKWLKNRVAVYSKIVSVLELFPRREMEMIILNEMSTIRAWAKNESPKMTRFKTEIYCSAAEWLCHYDDYPALIPSDEPYIHGYKN